MTEKYVHSAKVSTQIGQGVIVAFGQAAAPPLTILKAEYRLTETHHQPLVYWARDLKVAPSRPSTRARPAWDWAAGLKGAQGVQSLFQAELARAGVGNS